LDKAGYLGSIKLGPFIMVV